MQKKKSQMSRKNKPILWTQFFQVANDSFWLFEFYLYNFRILFIEITLWLCLSNRIESQENNRKELMASRKRLCSYDQLFLARQLFDWHFYQAKLRLFMKPMMGEKHWRHLCKNDDIIFILLWLLVSPISDPNLLLKF